MSSPVARLAMLAGMTVVVQSKHQQKQAHKKQAKQPKATGQKPA